MSEVEKDDGFDQAFLDEPTQEAPAEEKPAEEAQTQDAQEPPAGEAEEAKPGERITEEPKAPEPPPPEAEEEKIPAQQFKGYLDEREKRQTAEAETARLKAHIEQIQQSQRKEETPPPDIYENPEEYRAHLETQFEQRLVAERMNGSEFLARQQHGDDLVDTVKAWAQQLDEARAVGLTNHPSPYLAAVEAYRKDQAASTLKDFDYDIDKLVAARLKEQQAQPAPAPETPAPPAASAKPAPAIPPKVANAGGAQTEAPTQSEGDFFVSVFE